MLTCLISALVKLSRESKFLNSDRGLLKELQRITIQHIYVAVSKKYILKLGKLSEIGKKPSRNNPTQKHLHSSSQGKITSSQTNLNRLITFCGTIWPKYTIERYHAKYWGTDEILINAWFVNKTSGSYSKCDTCNSEGHVCDVLSNHKQC